MVSRSLGEVQLQSDRVLSAGVAVSAPVRADSPEFASGVIFPSWAEVNVAEFSGHVWWRLLVRFGCHWSRDCFSRRGVRRACDAPL